MVPNINNFKDMETIYFVCYRERSGITLDYTKEFLENKKGWNRIKIHYSYEDSREEVVNGFYDDSDYAVVKIENNIFYIKRGREW